MNWRRNPAQGLALRSPGQTADELSRVCQPCFPHPRPSVPPVHLLSFPGSGLLPSFPTRTPLPGPTPLTSRCHDEGVIFPPEAAKAKAGHCILRSRHSSLFRKISWRGEQDCGRGVRLGVPTYAVTGEMGGEAWGSAASEIAPLFSSPSTSLPRLSFQTKHPWACGVSFLTGFPEQSFSPSVLHRCLCCPSKPT